MMPRAPAWWDELHTRLAAQGLDLLPDWDRVPASETPLAPPRHAPLTLSYWSSGTTGAAKEIRYTAADWETTVTTRAACLQALGLDATTRCLVLASHGPWYSGDNIAEAIVRLGGQALCAGAYWPHMAAAARLLRSAEITTLVATPTAAQVLAAALDAPVRLSQVVAIGERAPPAVRKSLADAFGVAPVGLYAASECIIGPETEPDLYRWDPERLHLEVDTDAGIRAEGTGALLVTARHGEAQPLVRYRLGDRVVLAPPTDAGRTDGRVRFLGRIGHAFSLATGVRVGRVQVEAAVSAVSGLGDVEITVTHQADGRDEVRLVAHGAPPDAAPALAEALRASSIDLADALGGGFVSLNVECRATARTVTKRRLTFREQPWTL